MSLKQPFCKYLSPSRFLNEYTRDLFHCSQILCRLFWRTDYLWFLPLHLKAGVSITFTILWAHQYLLAFPLLLYALRATNPLLLYALRATNPLLLYTLRATNSVPLTLLCLPIPSELDLHLAPIISLQLLLSQLLLWTPHASFDFLFPYFLSTSSLHRSGLKTKSF